MTTLKIVYRDGGEQDTREIDTDSVTGAARWMYLNLKDWCVDEDISVYIDGELADKTYIYYKEVE